MFHSNIVFIIFSLLKLFTQIFFISSSKVFLKTLQISDYPFDTPKSARSVGLNIQLVVFIDIVRYNY